MEEKARVGMPDVHVGANARNTKKRKAGNGVHGTIEKRQWLIHL